MLFIDSARASTAKKNADLMVRQGRYPALTLPLAAMALYTLQSQAPSGGAGNRTSMRGGGPMVTIVRPDKPCDAPLWSLVWANVPDGAPLADLNALPWMGPPRTSEKGQLTVSSGDGVTAEAETFFGMPRRLWLSADDRGVTGVHQRPWGTNYEGWRHPLTPYYATKEGKLPRHPRAGIFGYRNWLGVVLEGEGGDRASAVTTFFKRCDLSGDENMRLIVAGWSMNNMSPVDFIWSEQPLFRLSPEQEDRAVDMVLAAETAAYVLASAARDGTDEDLSTGSPERARERFFLETQAGFEAILGRLAAEDAQTGAAWHTAIRRAAMRIFDAEVLPGLADLQPTRREKAVGARRFLLATLAGRTRQGAKMFEALGLPVPEKKDKLKGEAAS